MHPVSHPSAPACPECLPSTVSRRSFLRTASAGLAAALVPAWPSRVLANTPGNSETVAGALHHSLTDAQRKALCFGFDDPLRQKVDNNWHIVKPRVDEILTKDQQAMVREIFLKLHHPDHADRILAATEHDNGDRGLGACAVALFGEPGSGKFEFVLSGRHVTRRCDGDAVAGAAFGGPIFYGHAALSDDETADHPQNVYWFQAKRANEVYRMLDGKQREIALKEKTRPERGTETVKLTGKKSGLDGLPMRDLTADQRGLVRQVLGDLLAPFRPADTAEALKLIDAAGFDNVHLAFYKQEDIGDDGVWDIWQLEGPNMVWYFRGAPHVHTWVHIANPA